jgi:hypothetical protein
MEQTLVVPSMLMNVQEKLRGVPEIPMSRASIYQDLLGKICQTKDITKCKF